MYNNTPAALYYVLNYALFVDGLTCRLKTVYSHDNG